MEETNDSDIYADLPKFRYFDGLDKLQATNKSLNQEIIQLNETLTKITKEKDEYQTKCATLTNNISSLLKTAQAEIQRKDKLIRELRDQIASSTKQTQYRKRRFPEEEASSHVKRINNSKDFIAEKSIIEDDMKLNRSLDKILKENKNIVSENNDLSMCNNNNVRNAVIPDPKHNGTNNTSRRNGEISNINALLPPGGCKTLYSQRMFKKLHGLPVTNKSQEVQIESGDNQSVTEEKNISGKDTFNAGNTKLVETNASKQPKDLDKRSISSSNAEVVDASNTPSLTNASNIMNNYPESANKSVGDTSMLGIEDDVKKYNDVRKSVEPAANTDLQSTSFLKNNTKNIALDQRSKSLKALPLLELPSVENNFINKKEMNGLEVRNRTCENELFFRTVHSNQQNCQTKSQNLEESTKPTVNDIKSDTPKFLRPLSSTVIKKPSKKIILPVSNCWNGLVKTVDNVKERKEGEEIRTTENITATSSRIKSVTNSFNENKHINQDKLTSSTTRANNVLEDLFGSPLKWAENSNETTPLLELNSPTVYEDSCSAHIENAKFNLSSIKPAEQKTDPMPINHSSERNVINCKTVIENRSQNEQLSTEKGITSVSTNKAVRPFEEVGSIKQRMKSIFSPPKTDSCKSSASGLNINTGSSVDLTLNFPFKSKYEDSVLGQFDDTTQFFSALTKIESKISPLNTPVKSLSKPVTGNATLSSHMDHKSFSHVYQKLECNEITSTLSSMSNQKNFNEKPINILYPRKTPRIITYNKSNEEKSCTKQSSVVNDTPTKCNRFAINDAFISQQEEKVKRICKNNFNDPIAITICAKNKVKGRESSTHHSPQGKGSQTCSPRKSKLSPSCLKKNRGTFPTGPTTQKKLSNDLNVVDLCNNGNKKPLQSQISAENSSYVLIEKNSEKIAVEIPAKRNESVQETEYKGVTRLHNINNTIDNDIEKINKKETFNDFTAHSVLDRRKSNDSVENVDELDNNVKELHLNKSCTPNTNTNHGDCRKKYTENTTGISSENKEITVTKENAIRRDTLKDSVNPPSEDTAHNQTIVTQSLNINRNCDRIRVQNFKPSSHLRKSNKHSLQYKKQECERMIKNIPASLQEVSGTINVSKEFEISNYSERTPEKWKSNDTKAESKVLNGNINQDRQCGTSLKDLKKSPNIIIRSSKKPAFVSTTLSDDDFATNTVIKSPDINCRNHNKVAEVKEWILKPITFDSDHRSYKKQRETDNQKEVPRTVKLDSNNKTAVSSNIGSNDITNKSNKFAAPLRNYFSNVSSPNKKVILARRPLNFGVRVTLD